MILKVLIIIIIIVYCLRGIVLCCRYGRTNYEGEWLGMKIFVLTPKHFTFFKEALHISFMVEDNNTHHIFKYIKYTL